MPGDSRNESAIDYQFGVYRLDGRLRRLYKEGEPVDLTPKAVDTLVALIERAGHVVEKDELLHAVWNDTFVGEDTLAQNISTLRRVLGDDPSLPQFIATVPRRGYRFVASVRAVSSQAPSEAPAVTLPIATSKNRLILVGATTLAAAIGGFTAQRILVTEPPRTSVQFTIPEPEAARFSATGGMLAVSPDAEYVSFVAIDADGSTWLWLRPLASTVARRLDGTEGAIQPFWSPDSRTIAFFSERRLKAVDVASGATRAIASLASSRSMGGTWSRNGQILFSVPGNGMYLVAATGGSPERVVRTPDANCEGCGTWPYFLPDGRRFLYTVARSDLPPPGIYIGEVGKPGGERLLDAVSSSAYMPPGYVFYARSGTLYVQRFDAGQTRVTGTPIPLSDGVAYNMRTGRVLADISENGILAFRKALVTELVWIDRAGIPQGIAAPPATYLNFSIAPDGRRVAAAKMDPLTGTSDIWVFDDGREVRVTDSAGWDGDPVWSEDGHHVAYSSRREDRWRIYRRQATAVGPEDLLLDADTPVTPLQILRSTDIVYTGRRASLPFDLWKLGHEGSVPLALLGGFDRGDARLSGDEQWLAYVKPAASGAVWSQTIYVSAPPFGETHRAIAEAASTPRWRADGRELFYLSGDSTLVAIPVDKQRTPSDSPGRMLFRAPGLAPTGVSGPVYDVTRDGQRFLVKREAEASLIHVVSNWNARLGH
jgi:DNA-binding winged helix-turn-helix (wHTH) protein/Tol biopolymer transport system component